MNKINISIDVNKIDKTKLREVEYTNNEGVMVKQKMLDLDVIELKEPKFIKEGASGDRKWMMKKTHFVKQVPSAEEKKSKANLPFLGDGFQFETVASPQQAMDDILDTNPF